MATMAAPAGMVVLVVTKLPIMHTDDTAIQLMQTSWASALNQVLSVPLNAGVLLKSITLTSGANAVNHTLGRNLQGWFIVRQRATGSVYDTQDTNRTPALTLALQASANMVVDLFVF